jgi:hypothetical protein
MDGACCARSPHNEDQRGYHRGRQLRYRQEPHRVKARSSGPPEGPVGWLTFQFARAWVEKTHEPRSDPPRGRSARHGGPMSYSALAKFFENFQMPLLPPEIDEQSLLESLGRARGCWDSGLNEAAGAAVEGRSR